MAKTRTELGLVDLTSDVPPRWMHLVAKSITTSSQLDIWSVLVDLSSDVLTSQNGIFLTFQNCHILGPPHFCIFQYYSYGSE